MIDNNEDIRIVPIEEDEDDAIFYPYDDRSNDDNLPDIDW